MTARASPWRKRLGDHQERQARSFLEREGLCHVASNVRCKRGELDLVMRDDDTLVFIEVRFRASARFGGAAASVDPRKQTRLITAAAHYLQRHPTELPCRFDVIAIDGAGAIQWIRHAFTASA